MMKRTGGTKGMRQRLTGGLLLGLAVAVSAPACATKKDVKQLRDEMLALQAHQDSLFRDVQRQNLQLLDTLRESLRESFTIQQDAAGQTSHRFQQLEQQLSRTEELMYQMQVLVADVIERLDRQAQQPVMPPLAVDSTGAPLVTGAEAGEAGEAYDSGMEKIAEGAFSTARLAVELVIEQFPNHPLAPQAQYQIGQTYVNEGNPERAIEALEQVEARWPGSPRAAAALLQAGMLAEDRGDRAKALELYRMIRARYPGTDQYREATVRFNALGG
jgi:tol-pal system protein YbgF